MTIALSVLDQTPIRPGTTPAQAVADTIDLAKFVDRLGYTRYWVAEHHSTIAYAGPAPEILIGKLASETRGIRVGSGGVMLMHYSPFKVAEQFRMLETLYPGRIDLGIGRAPGGDGKSIVALGSGQRANDIEETFPHTLDLLIRYLEDAGGSHETGIPQNSILHGLVAQPMGNTFPEVWLLGSGIHSAVYAATLGQAFCHAYFINPENAAEVARIYRERFEPSARLRRPRFALAVSALAADTEEDAQRLSLVRDLWVLNLLKGIHGAFPSPAEAAQYPLTDEDRLRLRAIRARGHVGTPDQVKTRLAALAGEFGAEELLLVTITHDHDARKNSYELLAKEFALQPRL